MNISSSQKKFPDSGLSEIAQENISMEPQSDLILQKKSIVEAKNGIAESKENSDNKVAQKFQITLEKEQYHINQEEDMHLPKMTENSINLSFGTDQPIRSSKQSRKNKIKLNRTNFVTYQQVIRIQSSKSQESGKMTQEHLIRRKKPTDNSLKQSKPHSQKWINNLEHNSINHENLSIHKKQTNQLTISIISQKQIDSNTKNTTSKVIEFPLNNYEFDCQLSIKFSIKRSQILEIIKYPIQLKSQPNQIIQKNPEQLFPVFQGKIPKEQQGIKYMIERHTSKLKFSILLLQESKQKIWKDIEIPIKSYDITAENFLRIVEKTNGKVEIYFDEYQFEFFYKNPQNIFKCYILKGQTQLNQITVGQSLSIMKDKTPECESKCNIF